MAEGQDGWTKVTGDAWDRLKADLAPLEEALGRRVLAAGTRWRRVVPEDGTGPHLEHETGLRWEPREDRGTE